MEIKVKFVDKEHLEEEIKTIKPQYIKWLTQNGEQYTIIYEEHKNGRIQVLSKEQFGL